MRKSCRSDPTILARSLMNTRNLIIFVSGGPCAGEQHHGGEDGPAARQGLHLHGHRRGGEGGGRGK